jgi:hypothetical protein
MDKLKIESRNITAIRLNSTHILQDILLKTGVASTFFDETFTKFRDYWKSEFYPTFNITKEHKVLEIDPAPQKSRNPLILSIIAHNRQGPLQLTCTSD